MGVFGIAYKGFGKALAKRRSAFKESNKKAKKAFPIVGAAGVGMVAGAEVTKPKNKKNSKYKSKK